MTEADAVRSDAFAHLSPKSPMPQALAPAAILTPFQTRGGIAYDGEGDSQLVHAWQTAQLANRANASAELQLAAWLHDIGHLMTGLEGSPTLLGIDDSHEALGAGARFPLFSAAVAEPVRQHVAAKRYRVATQPAYRDSLSADSIRSLALQGGAMSELECAEFLKSPHSRDALRLRAWDDLAKDGDWLPIDEISALDELTELIVKAVGKANRDVVDSPTGAAGKVEKPGLVDQA
jgi:predicted HD phosphohydrolase